MKFIQPSVRLLAALAAAALAACGETPDSRLSPQPQALSASNIPLLSQTVARPQPLAADVVDSITVDRRGGTLEMEDAGLKLSIPSNALPAGTSSLTIKVTAFAGSQFAYEFEPAGTVFVRPLKFEQDVGNISLSKLVNSVTGGGPSLPTVALPRIGYFKSRADLNAAEGLATTFEHLLTDIDFSGHKIKANIWHFSGYIAEW